MEIKILGMGCPKCNRLEELPRKVASGLGVEATSAKVKDMDTIMTYKVLTTPALVIDEVVKSAGRVPRKEEIVEWVSMAQGS